MSRVIAWKSPLTALARRAASRQRRLHPARDWIASAVVLAGGLMLGVSCLPQRPARSSSAISLVDRQRADTGVTPAVFALNDSGTAVRFGNAELAEDGSIRIGFFNTLDPLLASATEPVSLPADTRLLWLLASGNERQLLRDKTAALVLALSGAARDVLASPEFAQAYRERFLDVFQSATRTAWQATQESGAWRALLRSYEPILKDVAARDVRPVVERHFRAVTIAMLRANVVGLIDPFRDRPWNMQPIEDALRAALVEMRDRDVAERTAARLINAPQTIQFLRVFQDELVRILAHSAVLQGLIAEMMFDERFRPYVADVVLRANELGRTAPRLLVSLNGSRDLNLVASTVIRTTVSGRPDRVVVFMTPAQRDAILALDRTAIRALERVGRS